jgi:hypothetical protein
MLITSITVAKDVKTRAAKEMLRGIIVKVTTFEVEAALIEFFARAAAAAVAALLQQCAQDKSEG